MAPCSVYDTLTAGSSTHRTDIPENVDTVVVGNGPSALILSYLLHGHVPYYDHATNGPHPDPILHAKLSNLFSGSLYPALASPATIGSLTEHFQGSRFSYSAQALPVNVLLDTLLRPNADTAVDGVLSRIGWSYEPDKAISHAVFGCARRPGGQWSERDKLSPSPSIEALSYAETLSLPGYTFAELFKEKYAQILPEFTRPTQKDVSEYLASYPARVGIEDSVYSSVNVDHVERSSLSPGFTVDVSKVQGNKKRYPHRIHCRHLVLASGIFSHAIPPPPLLLPLTFLPNPPPPTNGPPLLVIGSGFSAADVIISIPPYRKVLHLFLWTPDTHPSPLCGCHQQAYPEYAAVYCLMKLASSQLAPKGAQRKVNPTISPTLTRRCSSNFAERDWNITYEGLPNAEVVAVDTSSGSTGEMEITIQLPDGGGLIQRRVSGLEYLVGRRGSLSYLSNSLKAAILANPSTTTTREPTPLISAQTLRAKAALGPEITPNVFITGSLTGDSLIRFAFGGCVYVAGKIIANVHPTATFCTQSNGRKNDTGKLTTSNGREGSAKRGYINIGNNYFN
ncbi:MAG: hypothetical protein M1839_007362 [Geoglossum umbratile]|nr:MAG: hypothetical protein M1839_007362 [Geoglossum umbratile]